ncbi:MAG: TlpA family protein disulfide reductase [Bacteroidaceae bacterium]|nr:TlpA family protein disulfide reductase [Bacteroidaceae bacterium]
MKRAIIASLLGLVTMAGQAQIKCHIEGELRDTTQGKTVIVCPVGTDLRVSNNYITAKADKQWHFALDVEADKMCLYEAFLEEQYQHGSWRYGNFLVENKATVKLLFDDNTWKVTSGGREQMLKVKMDAEAEKLYLGRMEEISNQAKKEILPIVEELQKQGKNPEEDSLLMARNKVYEDEFQKLYDAYRVWESEYYKAHPMLYALYDLANDMRNYAGDVEGLHYGKLMRRCLDTYHTTYENFRPKDPVHNLIRMHEAAWNLKPGKPYHDFEVRTLEGKKIQVSSLYRGKVALIDFWASWCGPCRRHSKAMIPVYEKYKDKGFTVVAIARERETKDMILAAKQDGYPWESLIDIKDELNLWQKNGLGLGGGGMFLIDRDGTILSTSTDAEELEPLIRKALGLSEQQIYDYKADAEKNRIEPKDPSKPFTDFSVVYQGKTTRFSDYVGRGQYVLVDFWASWCEPCLKETPNLIAAYEKYKDKGLQVLGVAVSDKPTHTESAIKELGITYPQIINSQGVAAEAYHVSSIPYILLFDPEGNIIARNLRGEDIEKTLAEIFKEK